LSLPLAVVRVQAALASVRAPSGDDGTVPLFLIQGQDSSRFYPIDTDLTLFPQQRAAVPDLFPQPDSSDARYVRAACARAAFTADSTAVSRTGLLLSWTSWS